MDLQIEHLHLVKFDYDAKLLAREAYLFREQISGSKNQ